MKDDVFSDCNSSIRYQTLLLTGTNSTSAPQKRPKKIFGVTNSLIVLDQVKATIKLSIRVSRRISFIVSRLISLSA